MLTSPLSFNFTTLSNYVKPENTLESENKTWMDAKSRFYTLGEFHIFSESCKRRKLEEIEFRNEAHGLEDWQIDAIHTYASDLSIPLSQKEIEWLRSLFPLVCFRHYSITNARGIAVVLNNTLYFLS